RSFFRARRFADLESDLPRQLLEWLVSVNEERPSRATKEIPGVRLRAEQERMRPLAAPPADYCRESRHLAPLETPSITHAPLAEYGEFGTLRDDFTHGGHRWPNWERSRSWSQRTWCTKAPRSGRSPGRWA